ncbi:MAG: NADH-quinone oxidoreductase subunit A [Bdellovibrionota bacterium]
MSGLLSALILALMTGGFGILLLVVSGKLGPKRNPTPAKMMPYESGVPGEETQDSKVSVKFYLTAILFIIFDIEIIFMYPWAVSFNDFVKAGHGPYILYAMGVFILLFVVGLIWEVKSKALDWN